MLLEEIRGIKSDRRDLRNFGFVVGGVVFAVLHMGGIQAAWFAGGPLEAAGVWLQAQAVNPYACATMGAGLSVVAMVVVSLLTTPPSAQHLERVFGN